MKQDALVQLQTISESHKVDKIEAYIDYLEEKVDNLEKEKEDFKDEINYLISDYESEVSFNYPEGYNRSIVSDLVLEKLFENLNCIPLDKIEKLIDKHIS